jgi:transcriptional regulator with PAS, ATPase and Fis domain
MIDKLQKFREEMNPISVDMVSLVPLPESNIFNLKEIARKAAEAAEKEHIGNTLSYTNWNRKAAAKLLQVSYKALLYKIEKYQLNRLVSQKDKEQKRGKR